MADRQISPGIAHPLSRLCASDIRHGVPYTYRALHLLACSPRRVASYPLPVRRASALPPASFRRPVTRAALAVQLTVPRVGSVEDFHLQEGAPCRAHQRKSRDSHCESRLFRRRVFHDGPQSSPGRALPYRLSPGLPQLATVWGFTWFVWGRHLAAQKRRPGNRPLSLSVSFPQQ